MIHRTGRWCSTSLPVVRACDEFLQQFLPLYFNGDDDHISTCCFGSCHSCILHSVHCSAPGTFKHPRRDRSQSRTVMAAINSGARVINIRCFSCWWRLDSRFPLQVQYRVFDLLNHTLQMHSHTILHHLIPRIRVAAYATIRTVQRTEYRSRAAVARAVGCM